MTTKQFFEMCKRHNIKTFGELAQHKAKMTAKILANFNENTKDK